MHVALPKRLINQFKLVQENRQQALRAYCPNIYTVLLGQGFTVGYAFFGIPITMIMFQSMGERMNKFYTIVIKKYRSCRGRKRTEVSEFDLILASGSTSAGAISLLKVFPLFNVP